MPLTDLKYFSMMERSLGFSTLLVTIAIPPEQGQMNSVKRAKGTISLAQAKDAVPGPNCMLKSLWG